MSDGRPRRAARDSARNGSLTEENVPAAAAPLDTREILAPSEEVEAPAAKPASAAEPLAIAAETAATGPVMAVPAAVTQSVAAVDDGWAALTDTQAAFARACGELAVEVSGIARSGVTAGTDAALALLDARTFAEAIEINAGLVRRSCDVLIAGSARLSEIGVKAMTEATRSFLTPLPAAGAWRAAGPG